jgi:hypothetical protein
MAEWAQANLEHGPNSLQISGQTPCKVAYVPQVRKLLGAKKRANSHAAACCDGAARATVRSVGTDHSLRTRSTRTVMITAASKPHITTTATLVPSKASSCR